MRIDVMRFIKYLGWKSTLASILGAFVIGTFAWMILPPLPRVTIPQDDRFGRLAFSRDCRFIACAEGDRETKRSSEGKLNVWDTHESRVLFSVPYGETYPPVMDGGYSLAFTPEADKLVTYSWGKARFFNIPTGEPWHPDVAHEFPADGKNSTPSWLTTDAAGNLFVLVRDRAKARNSVLDLWSGKETGAWETDRSIDVQFPGGVIEIAEEAALARMIPSGEPRARLAHPKVNPMMSPRQAYRIATPDCRTLLEVDGTVRATVDGREELFEFWAHQFPAVSPDGRLLAVLVYRGHAYRDWLTTLLNKIGMRRSDSLFVVYDLTTGREVARLPEATSAYFSGDGKTLAIVTADEIELYDVPLCSPWGWILGGAMGGAVAGFFVAQWIRWRRTQSAAQKKPVQ